ncbi:MAG: response regulator [Deltaproteobacteria bacterium]|nr:response regulator [Deltaproteobacteria bacterium]
MKTRNKPLVLLVDDDPDMVELTAASLQAHGFDVVTAEEGRVGLDLALTRLPDVMVLDLALPDVDGLELVRCLRTMAVTSKIPVIAFSGHAFGSTASDAWSAGFDAVVTKAGDPDELLRALRRVLHLSVELTLAPVSAIAR